MPHLFGVLEKIIVDHHRVIGKWEYNKILFNIKNSRQDIYNYMKHLVASYAQQYEWQTIFEARDPTKAFITMDWCMKFLPRRNRLVDF